MERGGTPSSSLLSFGLFAGCCCRSSPFVDESVVMIALCAEIQNYSKIEIARPSGTRSNILREVSAVSSPNARPGQASADSTRLDYSTNQLRYVPKNGVPIFRPTPQRPPRMNRFLLPMSNRLQQRADFRVKSRWTGKVNCFV